MNIDWRSVRLTLAALAIAGAVAFVGVVFVGLFNVSARNGHLPGVSWVLHTTFRNSVDLRAMPSAEVPGNLSDPAMVALGAKHFDAACRICHSAPGQHKTATMRAMLPEPPHITEAVGHWEPAELHWILHEGVKMSGMPAWPSPRDDEVWPVVAFLMAVDRGMTGEEYQDMTVARAADGQGLAYCASCHGETGVSGNPHIPRLDILSKTYIARSLEAYATGTRESGIMEHAASEVPRDTLPRLARTFARAAPSGEAGPETDLVRAGRALALEGTGEVPACASCHGPWPEPLDEAFPSLAGQYEPYLVQQLHLWRGGDRGGTQASRLMYHAARELEDGEIAALAAFYAALPPSELSRMTAP